MPNGYRRPVPERIERVTDVPTALEIIANGVEDARTELLTEIHNLRIDVAAYRDEARSGRRLTWTVAGVLMAVITLVLAVARSIGA